MSILESGNVCGSILMKECFICMENSSLGLSILQLRLPTDMHTHRSTKPVLLALACGLWMVHRARICRIYTDASSSVHSFTAEWHSMVKEIVNTKQRTAIIHGNLAHLSIWRMLAALRM
jgi:hypothetical protein